MKLIKVLFMLLAISIICFSGIETKILTSYQWQFFHISEGNSKLISCRNHAWSIDSGYTSIKEMNDSNWNLKQVINLPSDANYMHFLFVFERITK